MPQKEKIPNIITSPPGPKSKEWHSRAIKHMKGYLSQVMQFPVAFEKGIYCTVQAIVIPR